MSTAKTRVNEADYRFQTLIERLRIASADPGTAASMPWSSSIPLNRQRADRREYWRNSKHSSVMNAHITVTNNTTASLAFTPHPTNRLSGGPSVVIRLHGHHIATVGPDGVELSLAHGWRAATTAQRLQEILRQNAWGLRFSTQNGDRHHSGWQAVIWTLGGASTNEAHVWLHNHPDRQVETRDRTNPYDNETTRYVLTRVVVMEPDRDDPGNDPAERVFIPTRNPNPKGANS